jgi:lipoprotein-anchoring transpeptidase ErfK/SrfK
MPAARVLCKRILSLMPSFLILALIFGISAETVSAAVIEQTYSPKNNELWIKIDKDKLKLYLRKGESDVLKSYPVAIGRGVGKKKSRTDLITPAGVFKIWRVIEDATSLVYDPKWFGEPGEPQKGAYGAKLISFYNPWEIALHGTNAPGSIGRRVTHGCIRMQNKDITELSKHVKPGMRIWIVERDDPAIEYDVI